MKAYRIHVKVPISTGIWDQILDCRATNVFAAKDQAILQARVCTNCLSGDVEILSCKEVPNVPFTSPMGA